MALYKTGSGGNGFQRGVGQLGNAQQTMGSMSKENQTTEIRPGQAPSTQILAQGVGLTGAANQLWNLGERAYSGFNWIRDKFSAPNVNAQAAQAESGAQAVGQAQSLNGMQTNSGAQVGEQMSKQAQAAPDFVNGEQYAAAKGAAMAGQTWTPETLNQAGELAAQNLNQQMYANPMLDSPEALAQSSQTAQAVQVPGPENVTSGLSGTIGTSVGGVAGGLAGRELGRVIGGDTGAAIGGVAGSLGGAYLGGLAMSSLDLSGAGMAGGAAAGATAGSAVPGMGTLIGAGIGALTSLFL